MGQPSIDLFASHHTTPSWSLIPQPDFLSSPVSLIAKEKLCISSLQYGGHNPGTRIKNLILQWSKISLLMNHMGSHHPLRHLKVAVWLISNNKGKQQEYLRNLKSSSQMSSTSTQVRSAVTKRPGISTLAGVNWDKLIFFGAVKLITNFLVNLFKSKLEHRILNCFSSMISAFHDDWNSVSVGKHHLRKRIRNSCIPTPQCKLVLDIKQALTYLEKDPLNNQLSLKLLTLKLAMLLALAKRLPKIKIIDTKFLAGSENKVVFSV